jgi:hypothetical protein
VIHCCFEYTVGFNEDMASDEVPFAFIEKIPKILKGCKGPHEAIYHFTNIQFCRFDVAVAVYYEDVLLSA